jgi:AcrR family transcriptional regulator
MPVPSVRRSHRRPKLRPQEPSRRDSREVFEAIVTAATEILAGQGMDAMTTNRVAERAGVGIASVYRYFKDKAAIIAEIDIRNRHANAAELISIIEANGPDIAKVVRACLRFFLDARDARSNVRRALMTEVPLSWIAAPARAHWSQVLAISTAAVSRARPDLSPPEIERRVFVALHAIQGVVQGQIVFPSIDLALDEAVAQVERLITPFLLQ